MASTTHEKKPKSSPKKAAPQASATSVLRGLLTATENHKKWHATCQHDSSGTPSADGCRKLLRRIKGVVTKFETLFSSHLNQRKSLVPACNLLQAIFRCDFCPHASAVFGRDELTLTTPPLHNIVKILAVDKPSIVNLRPLLLDSLDTMLFLLLDCDLSIFRLIFDDLVNTIEELRRRALVASREGLAHGDNCVQRFTCLEGLAKHSAAQRDPATMSNTSISAKPDNSNNNNNTSSNNNNNNNKNNSTASVLVVNISTPERRTCFHISIIELVGRMALKCHSFLAGTRSFTQLCNLLCSHLKDGLTVHSANVLRSTTETILLLVTRCNSGSKMGLDEIIPSSSTTSMLPGQVSSELRIKIAIASITSLAHMLSTPPLQQTFIDSSLDGQFARCLNHCLGLSTCQSSASSEFGFNKTTNSSALNPLALPCVSILESALNILKRDKSQKPFVLGNITQVAHGLFIQLLVNSSTLSRHLSLAISPTLWICRGSLSSLARGLAQLVLRAACDVRTEPGKYVGHVLRDTLNDDDDEELEFEACDSIPTALQFFFRKARTACKQLKQIVDKLGKKHGGHMEDGVGAPKLLKMSATENDGALFVLLLICLECGCVSSRSETTARIDIGFTDSQGFEQVMDLAVTWLCLTSGINKPVQEGDISDVVTVDECELDPSQAGNSDSSDREAPALPCSLHDLAVDMLLSIRTHNPKLLASASEKVASSTPKLLLSQCLSRVFDGMFLTPQGNYMEETKSQREDDMAYQCGIYRDQGVGDLILDRFDTSIHDVNKDPDDSGLRDMNRDCNDPSIHGANRDSNDPGMHDVNTISPTPPGVVCGEGRLLRTVYGTKALAITLQQPLAERSVILLSNCQFESTTTTLAVQNENNQQPMGTEVNKDTSICILEPRAAVGMLHAAFESSSESVRRRAVLQSPVLLSNLDVTVSQVNSCIAESVSFSQVAATAAPDSPSGKVDSKREGDDNNSSQKLDGANTIKKTLITLSKLLEHPTRHISSAITSSAPTIVPRSTIVPTPTEIDPTHIAIQKNGVALQIAVLHSLSRMAHIRLADDRSKRNTTTLEFVRNALVLWKRPFSLLFTKTSGPTISSAGHDGDGPTASGGDVDQVETGCGIELELPPELRVELGRILFAMAYKSASHGCVYRTQAALQGNSNNSKQAMDVDTSNNNNDGDDGGDKPDESSQFVLPHIDANTHDDDARFANETHTEIFSHVLGFLHDKSPVISNMAANFIVVLLRSCCGQSLFALDSVAEKSQCVLTGSDSHSCLPLLNGVFGDEQQDSFRNLFSFIRTIHRNLEDCMAQLHQSESDDGINDVSNADQLCTLFVAVGSIGASVRMDYVLGPATVGLEIVQWALLMLIRRWAELLPLCDPAIVRPAGQSSDTNTSSPRQRLAYFTAKTVAQEQIWKIASSQMVHRQPPQSEGGTDKIAWGLDPRRATWALFTELKTTFIPQLFVSLFSEPLLGHVSRAMKGILEELVNTVDQCGTYTQIRAQMKNSLAVSFNIRSSSISSMSSTRTSPTPNRKTRRTSFTSGSKGAPLSVTQFIKDSMQYVLPKLLCEPSDTNVQVLTALAKRMYPRGESNSVIIRTLLVSHPLVWIPQMVYMLSTGTDNGSDDSGGGGVNVIGASAGGHSNSSSNNNDGDGLSPGRRAWVSLLKLAELKYQTIIDLGRNEVLKDIVLRLVNSDGSPNEGADSVLEIVSESSSAQRTAAAMEAEAIDLAADDVNGEPDADDRGNTKRRIRRHNSSGSKRRRKCGEHEDTEMGQVSHGAAWSVSQMLCNKFMFLMGILSERVHERWRSAASRIHALRCTSRLLALIDGSLDPYFTKVLPMVKAALLEPQLQVAACDVLGGALKRLSIAHLCANIGTIVVSLLPCLRMPKETKLYQHAPMKHGLGRASQQQQQQEVDDVSNSGADVSSANHIRTTPSSACRAEDRAVELLRWLVVTRRSDLKTAFSVVHRLMPAHPKLTVVNQVLQQERGALDCVKQLEQLCELIQHKSEDVRLSALHELQRVLIDDSRAIHQVLLKHTDESPVLQAAITTTPAFTCLSSSASLYIIVSTLIGTLMWVNRMAGRGSERAMRGDSSPRNSSNSSDISETVGSRDISNSLSHRHQTLLRIRLACGVCLGELSAVDPSRLELDCVQAAQKGCDVVSILSGNAETRAGTPLQSFALDLGNEELAARLIELYLVDLLHGAPDSDVQANVSLSIQQLLRFFVKRVNSPASDSVHAKASPVPVTGGKTRARMAATETAANEEEENTGAENDDVDIDAMEERLQGMFAGETFDVVRPFWKTNYGFQDEWQDPKARAKNHTRFFGTGVPFETSVRHWVAYLTSRTTEPQKPIFLALRSLRDEWGTTDMFLFILPYVVQNVLCTGSDEIVKSIYAEVMGALQDTWTRDKCPGTNACGERESGNGDRRQGKRRGGSNSSSDSRVQLSAQTMFALLDTLRGWCNNKKVHENMHQASASARSRSKKPMYTGDFDDKSRVELLVNAIPQRALAEAAYFCGAYPRALMHFEAHVRNTHSHDIGGGGIAPGAWRADMPVQFERDEVEFLHSIYAALDSETDGLDAVSSIRLRHDGGPGTGYVLNRTTYTIAAAMQAADDIGPDLTLWSGMVGAGGSKDPLRQKSSRPTLPLWNRAGVSTAKVYSLNFGWYGRAWEKHIEATNETWAAGDGGGDDARNGDVDNGDDSVNASTLGAQAGDGGQPTLLEEIGEFEQKAKWDQALSCYEQALSQLERHRVSYLAKHRAQCEQRALKKRRKLRLSAAIANEQERILQHEREDGGGGNDGDGGQQRQGRSSSLLDEAVALTQSERGEHEEQRGEGRGANDRNASDEGDGYVSDAQVAQHLEMLWAQEQTLHVGQLRCLRRAGHMELLVAMAEGKEHANPRLGPLTTPYVMEAFWQLGRWTELDQLRDSNSTIFFNNNSPRGGRDSNKNGTTSIIETDGMLFGKRTSTSREQDHLGVSTVTVSSTGEVVGDQVWLGAAKEGAPEGISAEFTRSLAEAVFLITGNTPSSSSSLNNSQHPAWMGAATSSRGAVIIDSNHIRETRNTADVVAVQPSNPYAYDSTSFKRFEAALERARLEVMDLLAAASMESYVRAYPLMLPLHYLVELRHGWDVLHEAFAHRGRTAGLLGDNPNESMTHFVSASQERLRALFNARSWVERLKLTVTSPLMRTEILKFRQIIYRRAGLGANLMRTWLHLAKMEKNAGYRHGCESALNKVHETASLIKVSAAAATRALNAVTAAAAVAGDGISDDAGRPSLRVWSHDIQEAEAAVYLARLEHADMLKEQHLAGSGEFGGLDDALAALEPVSPNVKQLSEVSGQWSSSLRRARAKALLFATNLMVEGGQANGELIVDRYKAVEKIMPGWEKAHFCLGKYYDLLMQRLKMQEEEDAIKAAGEAALAAGVGGRGRSRGGGVGQSKRKASWCGSRSIVMAVMNQYGMTLKCGGHHHLNEALPRMLTIWFTYGETLWNELTEEGKAATEREWTENGGAQGGSKSASRRSSRSSKTSNNNNSSGSDEAIVLLERMCAHMNKLTRSLPGEHWYSALAQLVSRICHINPHVWNTMRAILCRVIVQFPTQALWQVMGVNLSNVESRKQRAAQVMQELEGSDGGTLTKGGAGKSRTASSSKRRRVSAHTYQDDTQDEGGLDMQAQVRGTKVIFKALISLALYSPLNQSARRIDVRDKLGTATILHAFQNCSLVVPTQAALSVTGAPATGAYDASSVFTQQQSSAPSGGGSEGSSSSVVHTTLSHFHHEARVMASKERPKKVTLVGHDQVHRNFLCKNERKGDLRKDSRMMEFCGVVNRMFQRDPRARRRKLRLRTYAVTCLNEACGLLEWVENTEGFRHLFTKVYQTEGLNTLNRQAFAQYRNALEQKQGSANVTQEERVRWYRTQILPAFPPRFHKWFLRAFPDPAQWLEARALYIKSAATWSMVGHIIGLGDRHAENLLLDVKRGECVHVDFDCLFDKGLSLQRPEIVPFRLTPHVVDGLDLGGVDGVYRTYCDVALGVLRGNKDALMSVLESFAVDPLVEWTRGRSRSGYETARQEDGKEMGKVRLKAVRDRLDGIVRSSGKKHPFDMLPLSTQGQVRKMIKEATDDVNLSQMYTGWAPFL